MLLENAIYLRVSSKFRRKLKACMQHNGCFHLLHVVLRALYVDGEREEDFETDNSSCEC